MLDKIKVLDKGYVELIDHMGSDLSIIKSARQSVGKETEGTPEENKLFIRNLVRWGHLTPLEFVTITFRVRAPLFVYRQWHRARTWSYVERSSRYSELPNDYYVPDEGVFTPKDPERSQKISTQDIKNPEDWWDCVEPKDLEDTWSWSKIVSNEQAMLRQSYEKFLKSGLRKELCRINTPVSQYSEMYATTDLRNLFHFLKLRLASSAQWEIRQYATALLNLTKQIAPIACEAFEDYVLNALVLTAKEAECLGRIVNFQLSGFMGQGAGRESCLKDGSILEKFLPNKREQQEFLDKLKKLGLENL